jgi:hypothetical protein
MTTPTQDRRKQMDAAAQEVVKLILRNSPECGWVDTTDSYARADGLLYTNRGGELSAIIEIKCRNLGLLALLDQHKGELMVDESKIKALQVISQMLCAPSYLVTYLMGSGTVIQTKITNDKGEIICKKRSDKTTASAGLGKGAVEKEMAYIKLDGTHIITTEGTCQKL